MNIENEHKYLLTGLPTKIDIENLPKKKIFQKYINIDFDNSTVERVRSIAEGDRVEYIFTKKVGKGSNCEETEHLIDEEEFLSLWKKSTFNEIKKIRFMYTHDEEDNHIWEIDLFSNGMVIAEIELPHEEYSYDIPLEFGPLRNVTNDKKYTNAYMSKHGV